MTKLLQWLLGAGLFVGVWWAVLARTPEDGSMHTMLVPLPVYLIIVFGCYSLATVGYRVITFNDCEAAAKELQEEIAQARKELSAKGIKMS